MQPNSPYPPAPQTPQQPAPQQGPGYDFIMNPAKPPRRSLLPSGTSPIIRVAIVLGGLLILFIIFSIIRGALTHSNTPALITVAQDQQEIIHLSAGSTQQQGQQQVNLSPSNQSFAITTQLSITSAQSDLLAYMNNNGKKVKAKTLTAKLDTNLDKQLTTAAANSTYDQTFKDIMQNKLNGYEQALKVAYNQTKGPKGRALLSKDYNGAQLLLQQLNAPAD